MRIKHALQIGESVPRIDGWAKATGRQVYPSDYFLEGMLSLRVLRSPHPHAGITRLDTCTARQVPGVACVLTADDIPGEIMTGLIFQDMPVLCDKVVRREGDPIAIVAAETDAAARSALDMIEVEYELLPVVSDPREALKPGSPLIHPGGNLLSEIHLEQGNVEASFANADLVFENEYYTGRQEHVSLETESGTAFYDEEGRLTIRFGGQHPHWDREIIAKVLGVKADELRVISPMMGGSFGGKDDIDIQCYLALVTYLTKRPCRMMFDRRESIISGTKRHPFIASYKTACTHDGVWIATEVTLIADTGAYAGWGDKVLSTAVSGCLGPYRIPNVIVNAYCVYTNNSNASAFRGFGAPQAVFPLEQQVDMMAHACGVDPIEFRRMNSVEPGQKTAYGFTCGQELSFKKVLDIVEQGPIYSQRTELSQVPEIDRRWKKRGVGIAAAWMGIGYGAGVPDPTEVHVRLNQDGKYQLLLGGTDMGQGNATALTQMVAHELNCDMEAVELVLGDSLGPDSGSCDAARQVTIVGAATVSAARDLYHQILDEAAHELSTEPGSLRLERDSVIDKKSGRTWPIPGLGELTGKGIADLPDIEALIPGIPYHLYTNGAQAALVEVDLFTGKIEVLKLHSVIDAGKVINEQGIEGQSEGGLAQGLGYALLEDCTTKDGQFVNSDLSTYIIPSISDVPVEIETTIIEDPGSLGPYGAKGIAELVLVPTAPAILNAVYDAIGERFTKIPLSAEDVLGRLSSED